MRSDSLPKDFCIEMKEANSVVGRKRKTSLGSTIMTEREATSPGEEVKERSRSLFSRKRSNTIESEGFGFRKSGFGSPTLFKSKFLNTPSTIDKKKTSLCIDEEKVPKKRTRERKVSLGSLGLFPADGTSSSSSPRRSKIDRKERSGQRKMSIGSLGGLFGGREGKGSGNLEVNSLGGSVEQCSATILGSERGAGKTSRLVVGSHGSLCSASRSKSVREQRLWFSVQWPGLSVSLPHQPLRRTLSDKVGGGMSR